MAGSIRNLVLFKLGWVACVLFAAAGEPLLATAAVALVVAAHLASVPVVVKEAVLLVAAAVIGMAWESLLVYAGLVRYPGEAGGAALAPYWIVAMWVLFAGRRRVQQHAARARRDRRRLGPALADAGARCRHDYRQRVARTARRPADRAPGRAPGATLRRGARARTRF
ncbi:MAG: DUF2878 domain-containing protein [Xanthomonadales bacterium]